MLIDWFTVGAQTLNFLVLVWLLKRFLYKPILDAIDAREKGVAKELADADAKRTDAQRERDEFQHKNEAFDQQRAALLAKAADEARVERQRLLEEARKAAAALADRRHEALQTEARSLNEAISLSARNEVFAIARKVLADLAGATLEERMGEVLIDRLRAMDGHAKACLAEALKTASGPAIVRSTFGLPEAQRAALKSALDETVSTDIQVRFEVAPGLISGVELSANGQKVAWSISDYLKSLERNVDELAQAGGGTAASSGSKAAESDPRPRNQ